MWSTLEQAAQEERSLQVSEQRAVPPPIETERAVPPPIETERAVPPPIGLDRPRQNGRSQSPMRRGFAEDSPRPSCSSARLSCGSSRPSSRPAGTPSGYSSRSSGAEPARAAARPPSREPSPFPSRASSPEATPRFRQPAVSSKGHQGCSQLSASSGTSTRTPPPSVRTVSPAGRPSSSARPQQPLTTVQPEVGRPVQLESMTKSSFGRCADLSPWRDCRPAGMGSYGKPSYHFGLHVEGSRRKVKFDNNVPSEAWMPSPTRPCCDDYRYQGNHRPDGSTIQWTTKVPAAIPVNSKHRS
eukprot:gnl/TRDRNA2_/TRDRNA2_157365_c0_seq1.p1 gnl/TRDRNA2_/TRDRNA2_157365_c0~~gnl/TRDRNA2_/TRDRNA2_157365_c0_seq1.p1  ORF type:complete len:309 (+),score=34.80 gnl/TRDRNA2_/TRDRNA2_157365_c0_seq1:33-929(+)